MAVAVDQLAPVELHESVRLADGGNAWWASWSAGFDIDTPLPVDEWADKYRVLPQESSSEHGKWRTDRTPYLREPMQCLSDDHPCKKVAMQFGTQTGKTEVGNNWLGSTVHQTPAPVMMVQPTHDMGQRWVRQRFNPMIAHTPALRDRIRPSRTRDSGNTATMKEFPGGFLVVAWSNSAAALSSMPVRKLFADEIDRYPDDVDGEGHPLDIAEARLSSFPRRKALVTASPTIKDESAIEAEFLKSDQRHYYVPCPMCDTMQVLSDDGLTDDGTFLCQGCGEEIEERHKTKMLAAGEWRAHNPGGAFPGFHLPSFYSPVGLGLSWLEIATQRAEAKGNPQKMRVYTNTKLAETYEDETGRLDWREIQQRGGGYSSREIPDGCMMLTAGVDTQDDRWAVEILGHGRGGRVWLIDWFEVPGQPAFLDSWEDVLDKAILDVTYTNRWGVTLSVLATGIDTGGHHTHVAYQYCRARAARGVLAFKGSKYQGRPILPTRPSPQDINTSGQVIRAGVDLWHVGVDTARGAIFGKLHADADLEPADQRFKFPGDLPDDFYQQLTNARFDGTLQRWIKPRHKRHEAGDCTLYAYAAACHPAIRVDKLRDADWDKIEAKIQPVQHDLFADAAPEDPAPAATSPASTKEPTPTPAPAEPPPPADSPKPPPRRSRSRSRKPKRGFIDY